MIVVVIVVVYGLDHNSDRRVVGIMIKAVVYDYDNDYDNDNDNERKR